MNLRNRLEQALQRLNDGLVTMTNRRTLLYTNGAVVPPQLDEMIVRTFEAITSITSALELLHILHELVDPP